MRKGCLYIFFLCSLFSFKVEGIQLKLSADDIKEAIRYGSSNKDLPHPELLQAWRIDLGYGVGSATLVTPYAGLIILAKESALKFREPTEYEIQKELEEKKGRLTFGCGLYGEEIDFATQYSAILEHKDERLESIYTSLPASAHYTKSYPASPKFWALGFFHFPIAGIGPNDQVTLVLKHPKQKELRFSFDLSKLR